MKLHNTLTRQTEEFKPIEPGEVKLYTCGPTVYDYAHIGNLRSFVFDDLLRRTLQVSGFKVKHVMNITDVGHLSGDMDDGEDKLEKGAAREQKSVWEVADLYIQSFKDDVAALNILPPNGYSGPNGPYARATDFIPQQQDIIKLLLDKGYAYKTDQAIYFEVAKQADYGQLSGQKLTEKETAARPEVVTDSSKKQPQDFAVWFFKVGRFANHSMAWPSPWGEGFPGWHLECSAIIHATLGEPIDIHTGGVDHIGTHHTNEIAQTEAAYGAKLANYWLHNEHLLVDGTRMAKSARNFYTLKDIKERGFSPLALRLLFLQSHYRSQMNFTWEAVAAAAQYLKNLQGWADTARQTEVLPPLPAESEKRLLEDVKSNLANDLNSAGALAAIAEFMDKNSPNSALLVSLDEALGLELAGRPDITPEQKDLLARRQQSRDKGDWPAADQLRERLANEGLEINDTPAGQLWRRH